MEPEAEYIADKDRANFCEFFQPSTKAVPTKPNGLRAEEARKIFDRLFGEEAQ